MGPLLRLHDKEGEGCGRVVGGGPGEGGGSWALRGEVSAPFAALLKIYNRKMNSELQGRVREGGGRGGPGEGGGSWALRGEVPLGAENLESRNKF